ncbi:MAG: hypothetical protein GC161_06660 [Planctomycetaceae bacterium]|nr:hypothetical protein [Planctomycetaceae bacterium]
MRRAIFCWFLAALAAHAVPAAAQFCGAEDFGSPLAPNGVASSQGRLFTFGQAASGRRVAERGIDGWDLLPGVFSGAVRAVADTAVFGLVATGDFLAVDDQPAARVARFDGTAWLSLGAGVAEPAASVRACVEHGGELYVGGSFASAGGVPAANVARFDGASWSGLNGGLNGTVHDLVSFGGLLVAAGSFTSADGLPIAGVAAWDGTTWLQLGGQNFPTVYDLEVSGTRLYAAGGLVRVYSQGAWSMLGAQPVDVAARSVVAGAGGIFVNGVWQTFCLSWGGDPCIVRARFADGVWSQLDFDDLAPTVSFLRAAAHGDAIYESGGSANQLRVYSAQPKLVNWYPKSLPWYGAAQLTLVMGCHNPQLPVLVSIGGAAPLSTTFVAPNLYRVDIQGDVTGTAGAQDLLVTQGPASSSAPEALLVLPQLRVQAGSLFAQYVRFFVDNASQNGTAWLFWSAAKLPLPLELPGIFHGWALDAGAFGLLGSGTLSAPTSLPTLGLAVPLGTFPPGLSFPAQAFVLEQTPDGPRLAFTNTTLVVMG